MHIKALNEENFGPLSISTCSYPARSMVSHHLDPVALAMQFRNARSHARRIQTLREARCKLFCQMIPFTPCPKILSHVLRLPWKKCCLSQLDPAENLRWKLTLGVYQVSSFIFASPERFAMCRLPTTYSYVMTVVMAAGIALIIFVPIPA